MSTVKIKEAANKLASAKTESETISALKDLVNSYKNYLAISDCVALGRIRLLLRHSNKSSLIKLLPKAFPECVAKKKGVIAKVKKAWKKRKIKKIGYGVGLGDSAYPGIDQATENAIVDDLAYGDGPGDIADIASDYGITSAAVVHFQKKHCVIPDQGSSRGFNKSQCSGGSGFSFGDITGGLKDLTSALLPVATTGLSLYQQKEQAKALEKQRKQASQSGFSISIPRGQPVASSGTPGWVWPAVIGGGGLMMMMMFMVMMRK